MSVWMFAICVFMVDLVVAFAWAQCIKSIREERAIESSLWAGFITLCGAFSIISYTNNKWLLIPAVIGTILGTYLSVKYRKNDN